MNSSGTVQSPTEEQKTEFAKATQVGINAAILRTSNPQEPANWSVLAGIYGVLATVGQEGAQQLALEALTKSRELIRRTHSHTTKLVVEGRGGNSMRLAHTFSSQSS